MKHTIDVSVMGQIFTVASDDPHEHVARVAADVDARMQEYAAKDRAQSSFTVAVLTALNIASEYQKLKQQYVEAEHLIERLSARLMERRTA